jgi:hypothetical protein
VVPLRLDDKTVEQLGSHPGNTSYGMRNLLAVPLVRELVASASVRIPAETVIGKNCFAVKGTFFNKTQESNWKVTWHQDLTIMVQGRHEVDGFGAWTVKAGIPHLQPPAEILNHVIAVRLHLDGSGPDNGLLRVNPAHITKAVSLRKRSPNGRRATALFAQFLGAVLCLYDRFYSMLPLLASFPD